MPVFRKVCDFSLKKVADLYASDPLGNFAKASKKRKSSLKCQKSLRFSKCRVIFHCIRIEIVDGLAFRSLIIINCMLIREGG